MTTETPDPQSPGGVPPGYPDDLVETAFLADGAAVVFRPVRPDDLERVRRLIDACSPQSIYRRFMSPLTSDKPLVRRLVEVDYTDRFGMVAAVGNDIAGLGQYERDPARPEEAEVALLVADQWQHRGIGTRLLWRVSAAARARGVGTFFAEVLGENRPMMGLLREMASQVEVRLVDGSYEVRMELAGLRLPS